MTDDHTVEPGRHTRRTTDVAGTAAAAGGLAGVAVVILVMRAAQVAPNPTISALLLLLVVLATATVARLRVAVAMSAIAMLGFNFFLLPPFYTLTLADPENWVALAVFLIVAIVGSQLSALARDRAREGQRAELASALIASFSHDLRTPLTSVRVALANLASSTLSEADRQEQAALAQQETERLGRILEELLDMARIDAAAISARRAWIRPADIIDAALAQVGPGLADRQVEVDAADNRQVCVDPKLTSSALAHLVENAVAYTPPSSPIFIRSVWAKGTLHVAVRDRGPGLDLADGMRMFEPFYRGSAGRKRTGGTGMGLAIARGLIGAQGGRVRGGNALGGGAEFTIDVPADARRPTDAPDA